MAQLTANTSLAFDVGDLQSAPVLDNVVIWLGSALGLSGGYARQLVAADSFIGFADQHIDNTVTGHASGFLNVPYIPRGRVTLPVVGVTGVTNVGSDVFASDGNTFTLTAGSNSRIGKIIRFVSSTTCVVSFNTL